MIAKRLLGKELVKKERTLKKACILLWRMPYKFSDAFANEGNLYLYNDERTNVQSKITLQVRKICIHWFLSRELYIVLGPFLDFFRIQKGSRVLRKALHIFRTFFPYPDAESD